MVRDDGTEGGVRAELAVLVNRHIPVADLSPPGVPYAAPVPVSLPDRATGTLAIDYTSIRQSVSR